MLTFADLPEALPIFPLPGALMLPRTRLPLHIFEPRYLAMLDDVLKTPQRLIGMIQPLESEAGDGEQQHLHRVGSAGRLTAFSETEDGRYMITLTGVCRYRIERELSGFTPYMRGQVDWSRFKSDLGPPGSDPEFDREVFLDLLRRYFALRSFSTDWAALQEADEELLINSLSMLCPFDPADKQALLEAPSLAARRKTLVTLIEFALRGGSAEEVMQ